jgi:UDP-glucose 4-epimerase
MKPAAIPSRVAVTGGAGFIGTHTVRQLLERGVEILVIDDFRHARPEPVPAAATLVRAEIASPAARQALVDFKPGALIHLGAQGGVNRSLQDPAADALVNVVGTVAVLRATVDAHCPRLVFASSGGAIYGRARRLPSREGDQAKPLSPYGAAKLACEGYLGMFSRTFGLHFVALRYGNVYGPYQDGTGEAGVVAITSTRLRQGLAPQITGDGGQTRDFTFLADVAATHRRHQVIHLASANPVHPGLLDHHPQGPLDPPPGLQQAGQKAPLAQLGDLQLQPAHSGVHRPRPVPFAVTDPALGALVGLGTHRARGLGLDQGLQGVLQDLPQRVLVRVRDVAKERV